MRMTRSGHTHFRIIEGGKPDKTETDHFTIRLRHEQAKDGQVRKLTTQDINALHDTVDRDKP